MRSTPAIHLRRAWPGALLLALPLLLLACVGCTGAPSRSTAPVFVVVRHAEKVGDGSQDPALDATGRAHARALAARLAGEPLAAAYATPFRRTRDTARPAADAHAMAVRDYDPDTPADALAAELRRAHREGTVLVVGHSNTVPGIVAALCGCTVAPLPESRYGDLYRVQGEAGHATLTQERF